MLLVSLDCLFSSLPFWFSLTFVYIFHTAWSKFTLPLRKTNVETNIYYFVMADTSMWKHVSLQLERKDFTLLQKKTDSTSIYYTVKSFITTYRCENICHCNYNTKIIHFYNLLGPSSWEIYMNGFIFNFLFWYLDFVCFHSSVFDYVNCGGVYLSANKTRKLRYWQKRCKLVKMLKLFFPHWFLIYF